MERSTVYSRFCVGVVKRDSDDPFYIRLARDGSRKIIVSYVDGMLIVARDESELTNVAAPIEEHVDISDKPSVAKIVARCALIWMSLGNR